MLYLGPLSSLLQKYKFSSLNPSFEPLQLYYMVLDKTFENKPYHYFSVVRATDFRPGPLKLSGPGKNLPRREVVIMNTVHATTLSTDTGRVSEVEKRLT